MKYLIVFACALVAASASNLLAPIAGHYPGSQHLPVIGANGVPVDTAAVQQAVAEHLVHKVEAHVRNGDYVHPVHGHAPVSSALYPIAPESQHVAPIAGHYPGPQHHPVIGANGVPVDTLAVQQAAAEHLAHKVEAHVRNGDYAHPVHGHAPIVAPVYPIASESEHLPIIGANGVPVDTPAVQQAAAEHLAHKVEAYVRNGDYAHPVHGHAPIVAPVYPIAPESEHLAPIAGHYPGSQHFPVIGANGVPVDTPAVQQAAAEHLAHKVEAHVRNGDYVHPVHEHTPVVAPVSSAVYPIAGVSHAGLPLDTAEVAAAKINHFAAHAKALTTTGYSGAAYTYPYTHFYRTRRAVVAPVTYSAYTHTPVVAQTYTPFPFTSAFHYRKRRGVVAPFAYTGYTHSPVVNTYSALPYTHYY